ncbi:DUF1839 family protein [Pararobbsia silviterrae]|uniref:DUF1839 family protein n=1 Tax=Pararobbsia silviterrae TaxID=1792498 RepID=A0A494XB54_9BURK|nr:DUF1839 family protein [Pararobbsia silviterrae]RKP45329.1 DUF1839 family protein [Pararobbsia silviterrae]
MNTVAVGAGADLGAAAGERPAAAGLHAVERGWQETNCYVDLWLSLLAARGCEARAGLAFTVTQDFEGDQFTFFKFPLYDLDRLYGVSVQELAIYDALDEHVEQQVARGHTVLVEMDAFYLPDTRATSYRRGHTKTTIGIDRIDRAGARLGYFHNAGYFTLDGEDYAGVFRKTDALRADPDLLFPYVEFVKQTRAALTGEALAHASLIRLREHLAARPAANPISAFRAAFPAHLDTLIARGEAYFHLYAFNTLRQLGANFELLGLYLGWLAQTGVETAPSIGAACATIASEAKVLQFRIARAMARRRPDACNECFDLLERAYEDGVPALAGALDVTRS